jgi:CubicO group peptidase (beta-lactamase class C family)
MIPCMATSPTPARLDVLAQELRAELGVPGLAAGAAFPDGSAWSAGAGLADRAAETPATPATRFRIGSVTKTFTIAAAVLLADDGALALDGPAVEILPELGAVRTNGFPLAGVTLRRLLTHRSGLIADPPTCDWSIPRFPSMEEMLATLDQAELTVEPGTLHKYCNIGIALAGEMVARAAGRPCETVVEERLLRPLGLDDTGFAVLPDGPAAVGYAGEQVAPRPDIAGLATAGQMYSTVGDLLRWMSFVFGQRRHDALPPAALTRIRTPDCAAPDVSVAWTMGWTMQPRDGGAIHRAHGDINGFSCAIGFDPVAGVGAALLTNGEAVTVPAMLRLLDAAVRDAPPPRRAPASGPAPDRALVGGYVGALRSEVEVSERDGALQIAGDLLELPEGPTPLEPLGPDAYRVVGGRFAGERLTARRDADGSVAALALGSWRFDRLP